MLAPAFDVLREFVYALGDLLLALPRHMYALLRRRRRLAMFEQLRSTSLEPLPEVLPEPEVSLKKVILSCGDNSGETHALRLLAQLQARHPGLQVEGFGGRRLGQAGMDIWNPLADLNVMGFKDVAAQLPLFFGAVHQFAKRLRQDPPDVVVLVDYPGMNRHLLRIAQRQGVKVVHYIAPQLWAWAPWRVRDFRCADRLLTILPFEQDWYAQHGAEAPFVGHPLADSLAAHPETWDPPLTGISLGGQGGQGGPETQAEWIAILPGSRRREIRENLSLMLAAAALLQKKRPQVRFVLPHQRAEVWPLLEELLSEAPIEVERAPDQFHEVLRVCRGAWVVSGTASLEVAALGIPSVVVYRMGSRFGAWLAGHALAVPYVGAANLIAGEEVAPEQVGHRLDPTALCDDLLRQIDDEGHPGAVARLRALHDRALAPGTDRRAAMAVEACVADQS